MATKKEAGYVDQGERCGLCEHFKGPNRCTKVDGHIKLNAWCRWFETRAKKAHALTTHAGGLKVMS